jgi:cytochrome c peroxidase
MKRTRWHLGVAFVPMVFVGATIGGRSVDARGEWSAAELATLRSLSIESLEPLAADPSNRYGDDPRAVELGHKLFFDTRLSSNGKVSCATCHVPGRDFQDGTALGAGMGTTDRRTMPIAATAHGPWMFWDGRKDSQWSQALGPLESPVEHGGDRTQYAHLIAREYRREYEAVFGALPNLAEVPPNAGPVSDPKRRSTWDRIPASRRRDISRVYAHIGKAIAAYERRLQFGPSRFDRYVDALVKGDAPSQESSLSRDEVAGLRVFIGKGSCVNCHNGALLTDNHFHNTGIRPVSGLPSDEGRAAGVRQVLADEFNCLSEYSDASPSDCQELRFVDTSDVAMVRAYKTPTLRGVARRAPYMHAGQLSTLEDVVSHYDRAPRAPSGVSELRPLKLSETERRQLVAFLKTLDSPVIATSPELLRAP